jgi:hypothetical protein
MKFIFLTYLNRSGSTFLANQLSKTTDICVCPEAEILYHLFLTEPLKTLLLNDEKKTCILNELEKDKKFALWKLPRIEISNQITSCRNNLEVFIAILSLYSKKVNPKASHILYKNSLLIDLLPKIPKSLIKKYNLTWISLLRDIRAVYLSQSIVISPFTGKPMCNNWYTLAKQWNAFLKKSSLYSMLKYFIMLKYEDLILDTTRVMKEITFKLQVDYQLNWIYERKGVINELLSQEYISIHPLIDQMPDKSRIDRWKYILPSVKQCLIGYYCFENLKIAGYSVVGISSTLKPRYYAEIISKIISDKTESLYAIIKRNIKRCLNPRLY